MKSQLQRHQQQMEEARATIASLHSRQMADREAIGSLMGQLQEVRLSCATGEAKIGSLKKELQDTSSELSEALARVNRQVHVLVHVHVGCQGLQIKGGWGGVHVCIPCLWKSPSKELYDHILLPLSPPPSLFFLLLVSFPSEK